MTQKEKYIFEANRFADIETLSEVYNQYYAYIVMSNLNSKEKKNYLDYILKKQKELTIDSIKTPSDLENQNKALLDLRDELSLKKII